MTAAQEPFRFLRCLVAAASGFLFTFFFFASWETWQELSTQNWDEEGLGWLKADFWARQMHLKEAAAGGALTLVLAVLGELLRKAPVPGIGLLRWGTRVFGGPAGFVAILVLALLPRGIAGISRPAAEEAAPNVMFVLVDTWRGDRTSFLGYERETWPLMDELVEEGVVFERAITQAPWTKPTVATLFTSLVPSKHGAMSHMPRDSGRRFVAMGNRHTTLAEKLAVAGYDTVAITHNANIQPVYGFGQGFREFRFLNDWDLRAETMIAEAEDWLQSYDGDRPFFCYLHLTDPHYPYDPPAPYKGTWDKSGDDFNLEYDVIKDFHEGKREISAAQLQHLFDAYDEEMLYTDSQLTPFLKSVQERYPNTIVVLVGDHGDELWEHDSVGHGHVLFDELTWVPLVLWGPTLDPARVAGQVRLLDVFPTLMELTGAGGQIPQMMGSSLVPMMKGEEQGHRPAPMETGGDGEPPWHVRGLSMTVDGVLWKMIRNEKVEGEDPDSPWNKELSFELYNLDADPLEQTNLAAEHPELVEQLFETMKEMGWYTHPDDLEGEEVHWTVSDETAENLEGLGYMDAGEEDDEE